MNRSTPGLPVHHQLPEFTETHVHRVSDAIQPSHPLSSPSPPAPIPPSIRVFSNESTLHMSWPKYWSFSFSIIPSKEIPGLISFKYARQWRPTPVLLPGKSHGRKSLVGCSLWSRSESDTTERLHFHFSLSCVGKGNGKPLQYSCLENARDGGAWWAAISGVAQSRTRLK